MPPVGELYGVERDEADDAAAVLVDLVAKRLQRSFGVHPIRDVQVLVPTHRGPLGAQALDPGVARGRRGLSPGEKVMRHKNDDDFDVWNGDLGVVARLEGEKVVAVFDGREVLYAGATEENLSLAYAATVHESRRSEYDAVVVGLHRWRVVERHGAPRERLRDGLTIAAVRPRPWRGAQKLRRGAQKSGRGAQKLRRGAQKLGRGAQKSGRGAQKSGQERRSRGGECRSGSRGVAGGDALFGSFRTARTAGRTRAPPTRSSQRKSSASGDACRRRRSLRWRASTSTQA